MATHFSGVLHSPFPPSTSSEALLWSRTQRKPSSHNSNIKANLIRVEARSNFRKENVVIVGAGIAGLATALSLHRLGIKSLVLEQADSLRTSGTSLTLFKNGWHVLDVLGVADDLRSQFLELQGMVIKSEDGRDLRKFQFKDESVGQEVRGVERRTLLESLASQLPMDSVCFSSRLTIIERDETGETLLELDDGTRLLAKIVIGCDGVRSPIAKWMGFSDPHYVGHCAIRGLGVYPDGQPFEPNVSYVYGRGLRAGYVPLSSTKVYWFICFNSPSPGPKTRDPSVLKQEALDLVRSWPEELLGVIERTPDEAIVKTPLGDRWLWPIFSPAATDGSVVLAGDAWHPMTPNLGQGACCALEDAVILARKLADALDNGQACVDKAMREYAGERWTRIFPLTVRANIVGSLLQWENPVVCAVRNSIVIPKLARLGPFLEHTNFECELLK